jgi:hypothetical protein
MCNDGTFHPHDGTGGHSWELNKSRDGEVASGAGPYQTKWYLSILVHHTPYLCLLAQGPFLTTDYHLLHFNTT